MRQLFIFLLGIAAAASSYAENIGLSVHEFQLRKNSLSAELIQKVSIDEGLGFQARFTHHALQKLILDAGYGFHSGDWEHRIFAGGSIEIFPDYKLQPRLCLKGILELAGEIDDLSVGVSVIPIFSKGISFAETVMYPFLAFPMRHYFLDKSQTQLGVSAGSSFELTDPLTWNFEVTVNLYKMPTSFTLGLSMEI